ncbi:MAG: bifunctional DNA-formamidopyrimidine glycosylase/DNA-(apurinic or apyrimidinic site) lyase [Chloroflexi bacterium]|nr:bifunctional DNA-formamidopyrimidine glycosylase/DNA-(apurinic or apyrimidinic site) lyase [Chloroflexota bacterium]
MPELPEVETVARDLRRHLLPEGGGPGPVVAGARVAWPGTLRDGDVPVFVAGVAGRRIEAVGRRGKLLILDLDGGTFLTVHLKMTGQLFVVPAALPVDPYERLALILDDDREIRFRDIRKFGRVGLYAADDRPFDGIGPEPLDPRFTLRAFRGRIRGRRARLKPLLVDQGFIAGVGNIYADEALWRSKLHPLRSAASLRPHDERALYPNVLDSLTVAVERRGSSIDDYTAPDGDGEMQEHLDVYQRTGRPCPRCGRPIRRIVIGIRATHFCSFCQRLPAGERPAAAKLLATMTPRPGRAAGGRRGRRWVDLDGDGALGRTLDEGARARERTARTKAAAAARRAAARRGAIGVTTMDGAADADPGPADADPGPADAAKGGPT